MHEKCSKTFDENEIIDSMNIDEDNQTITATTTNNFVRERIEEIFKRKIDEKDFHNEEDDEQMEELFEHLLPSKDSEDLSRGRMKQTNQCDYSLSFFLRKLLLIMMMMMMKMVKRKVKNV